MIERDLQAPVEPAFSHFYSFPFDPFQVEAIAHIREDRSVMVAAPTSAGKTVVAEYALWRALQTGTRAIYTTPIKALSNQKRRDLEGMFPGKVGLLTGDRSEHAGAPIVVMTTEVLRNMLVEGGESLRDVSTVVFDEVHYLADPDRGTVWEESIITCPPHVQLVCLSATIANAEEIAAWISETHRETALIRHDERPVPLEHYYFTEGRLHLVRDVHGRRRALFPHEGKTPPPHPADVVRALGRASLLPAIWFAFSRQAAEDAAEQCVKAAPRLTAAQRERIESALAWTLGLLPAEDRGLPQISLLANLLRRGVAFHHAGLLPPLKELVEQLFGEGLLAVVCATDTLAVGINMPARTVVISSLARPLGGILSANDFSQLTGRAGRRGIDELGGVVMLSGRSYRFEDAYREVCGPLHPVNSAFRLRYSTLLSASEREGRQVDRLVRASLRQYQMKARARRDTVELAAIRKQLEPGDEEPAMLEYLALAAHLSDAEKEQKRARNARAKSPHSAVAGRRLERARRDVERLRRKLKQHRCHGRAMSLERWEPDRMALLRTLSGKIADVRGAEQKLNRDAAETADAVRRVLARLGYIGKRGLTSKARGLREIVAAPGIVLTELYDAGALDNLDPAELAEAVSWFASDSRRRRENSYRLRGRLDRLRREAEQTYRQVAAIEEREGIELAQGPSEWFYGVAFAWCRGASIADITDRITMGEGDIVGVLNKTVDLLDQLEGALREYGDTRLMAVSAEARRLLVRGLVAMVRSGDRFEASELAAGS